MTRTPLRRGYAMLLVLIAVVVVLLLHGVAYRHMACALRTEAARVQQQQRDEGTTHAIARALTLLETGLPPHQPYICGATVTTETGTRSYTITLSCDGGAVWSVQATPTLLGEDPEPMPGSFAP